MELKEQPVATATAPVATRTATPAAQRLHRIVIVGGGAGGLELATCLGHTVGRRRQAEVVLLDRTLTHVWKPLLHELAAGSPSLDLQELDYLAQAKRNHFVFHLGELASVDRAARRIMLAPIKGKDGRDMGPARSLEYDTLVIAVGSLVNDFGTPGVAQHAFPLNSAADAREFHRRLLCAFTNADIRSAEGVDVVIVGGGATGVELAAELRYAMDAMASYRFGEQPRPGRITIVEANNRLVGALSEQVADRVRTDLQALGVVIETGQRVSEVKADSVVLGGGRVLPADLTVWCAGIKAPAVLKDLGGLETDKMGRLVVTSTLQTTRDPNIFAMGDCAAAPPRHDGAAAADKATTVPPLAQAAHQEARLLARSLPRRLTGQSLLTFQFKDRGALVSLSHYSAVASLARLFSPKRVVFEGWAAQVAYRSLYLRHLETLYGAGRTALLTLAKWISGLARPRVKLH